jgi:hypothetical protein
MPVVEKKEKASTTKKDLTPSVITKRIKDLAGKLYGKDNVDVVKSGSSLKTTIRFPKVTIKNSRGDSRTITDLYVKFTFNHQTLTVLYETYGRRGSLTVSDILSGYRHSHLTRARGREGWGFTPFCTGSGPINGIVRRSAAARGEEALKHLDAYIIHLRDFVAWESLEGGPHYRMANIPNNTQNFSGSNNLARPATLIYSNPSYINILMALKPYMSVNVVKEGGTPIVKVECTEQVDNAFCAKIIQRS